MHDIVRIALQSQQEIPGLSAFIEGPEDKIRDVKLLALRLHERAVERAEICPAILNVGVWGSCKVFHFAIFGDFVSDAGKERFSSPEAKVFVHHLFDQITLGYVHEGKTYLLAFLDKKAALALDPLMNGDGAKGGDRTHA